VVTRSFEEWGQLLFPQVLHLRREASSPGPDTPEAQAPSLNAYLDQPYKKPGPPRRTSELGLSTRPFPGSVGPRNQPAAMDQLQLETCLPPPQRAPRLRGRRRAVQAGLDPCRQPGCCASWGSWPHPPGNSGASECGNGPFTSWLHRRRHMNSSARAGCGGSGRARFCEGSRQSSERQVRFDDYYTTVSSGSWQRHQPLSPGPANGEENDPGPVAPMAHRAVAGHQERGRRRWPARLQAPARPIRPG